MSEGDCTAQIAEQLRQAVATGTPLAPCGAGSKGFLGRQTNIAALSTAGHRGIVNYAPTELTVTARSGTPLAELQEVLAEHGQGLPFEPPHYGAGATIGGTIAAGLSGPARAYAGAARDFVLGTRILNGRAEALRFGGEVMKNVAGYDVSRLMTGAMGTLGVLLDISLKVLPVTQRSATHTFQMSPGDAIRQMNAWATKPFPISATTHMSGVLYVRVSGSEAGVETALARLGGEPLPDAEEFWHSLTEHSDTFFRSERPLWRVSVPSTSAPLALPGESVIEWGGALRWLASEADADSVRSVAASAGGHAMLFRGGDRSGDVYHPLEPTVLTLHQRLKKAFDPHSILNPGRMYPEF